jgi:hypothetical protein
MAQNSSTNLSTIFQKPDTIDTPIYEKPHAYDEEPPVVITASRHGSKSSRMTVDSYASRYFQRREKKMNVVCRKSSTRSSIMSRPVSSSSTYTTDQEIYYSPNTPVESPPLSPKSPTILHSKSSYYSQIDKHITSYILSQPLPTTQTTFAGHHDDLLKDAPHYVLPSSPANSITGLDTDTITAETLTNNKNATSVVAAAAALLSNDSGIVSSFFLQQQNKKNRTIKPSDPKSTVIATTTTTKSLFGGKTNNNVVVYNFKKASVLKPNQHQIFLHIDHHEEEDEEVMVYRKIQPYSYTRGFQSMLYVNRNDGQGIKVAEARRKAFGKDITIDSADYESSAINDITQPHIPNLKSVATNNYHSQELVKRSQSNILFEYETWFHGSRMRWKRPSLLSHDFTCEIKLTQQEKKKQLQQLLMEKKLMAANNKRSNSNGKKKRSPYDQVIETMTTKDDGFIDSDSDNDEDDHDNHTHKTCRRWKLIAEFHGHHMSYLSKGLGILSIDLDILNQVEKERCDLLEANIVMTCCTLIDLIREVMGK